MIKAIKSSVGSTWGFITKKNKQVENKLLHCVLVKEGYPLNPTKRSHNFASNITLS